jgi:hypothetical protein
MLVAHLVKELVIKSSSAIAIGLVKRECNGKGIFSSIPSVLVRLTLGPMMKQCVPYLQIKEVLKTIHGVLSKMHQRMQLIVMVMLLTTIVLAQFITQLLP